VTRTLSTTLKSTAVAVVIGATLIMLTASQALAQVTVSQASAVALGGNLLTSGSCASTNDSTVAAPGTQTSSGIGCTAGGPGSNSSSFLSASVLVQTSDADPNSTSAACAGATGPGGAAIQVGAAGPCTGVSAGTSAGVNVIGGLVTADAVYSVCSATPTGPTGTSTLASAGLGGTSGILSDLGDLGLGTLTGAGALPVNPGPNTTVNLALGTTNILSLILNQQTTSGSGQLTVTALNLTLLGSTLTTIDNIPVVGPLLLSLLGLLPGGTLVTLPAGGLNITIGTVTCGPNAVVPVSPALPKKALPIAGGIVVLAAGGAYLGRRRLFAGFHG